MIEDTTTIAAIATARGHAGVAVIRISGPISWDIARQLFSKPKTQFQGGRFYHGWIVDPTDRATLIDEVLLLVFKAPHSYTGEDVIEIHCHGGDYLSHKILSLCLHAGAQPAEAGEFTKRAYLNGKMDLTQAESVMDLIAAKSDRMLEVASANLRNRSLGGYMDQMRERLIAIQSLIVASVDFPDEVDEPDRPPLVQALEALVQQVHQYRQSAQRNQLIRDGFKVALLGLPNSGKSSLFNKLLASDRAIVTDIAGTTRDVLTETLQIKGIPVTLIDTAGIREAENTIEILGIERSWQAATEAQAVLYIYDATLGLQAEDRHVLDKLKHPACQLVANKIDQITTPLEVDGLPLSAMTGQHLDHLFQWLESQIAHQTGEEGQSTLSLNHRQRHCLEEIYQQLRHAQETLRNPSYPLDLVTVPITEALRKLDELMGRDTAEEVLSSVFSQFCVGK